MQPLWSSEESVSTVLVANLAMKVVEESQDYILYPASGRAKRMTLAQFPSQGMVEQFQNHLNYFNPAYSLEV